MEKVIDFDEWMKSFIQEKLEFVAIFDPIDGRVTGVGPSHAFVNEKFQVPIDQELFDAIMSDEIPMHRCIVDTNSNMVEVAEIKKITKIDDVLHRIISVKNTTMDTFSIFLTHDSKKKTLKIELSVEFGGTKKTKAAVKPRKIVWDGDTEMLFFITDYNDPNIYFEVIPVKIHELIGKYKKIENFTYENFSVYTKRFFKNYAIKHI